MLSIPNVTIRKCTRQNVTIRKCTIRNVTDPVPGVSELRSDKQ